MINYNDLSLTDADACPDPRLLLPNILKELGELTRLKICEAEASAKQYTTEEVKKLHDIVSVIEDGLSDDTLEKLQKIATLFDTLDHDSDGSLHELADLLNKTEQVLIKAEANQQLLTTLQTSQEILQKEVESNKEYCDLKILNVENKISDINDVITNIRTEFTTTLATLTQLISTSVTNLRQEFDTKITNITNTTNTNNEIIKNTITNLQTEITEIQHNQINNTQVDEKICLSNKHLIKAFETGMNYFKNQMNMTCDLVLPAGTDSNSDQPDDSAIL